MMSKGFFLAVLALLASVARCEIVPLSLILDSDSTVVHYIKGYLLAPGRIDLSGLKFVTTDEPAFIRSDDDEGSDDEDDDGADTESPTPTPEDNGTTDAPDDNGVTDAPDDGEVTTDAPADGAATDAPADGAATDAPSGAPSIAPSIAPSNAPSNAPSDGAATDDPADGAATDDPADGAATDDPADGAATDDPADGAATDDPADGAATDDPADGAATDAPADGAATDAPADGGNRDRRLADGSFVDIVVFRLPADCATSMRGCDWSDLGVGAKDDDVEGGVSYCCSEDVISRGVCDSREKGRLIIDDKKFTGERREMYIKPTGESITEVDDALYTENIDGEYILVLANCDDFGREILTFGSMEWVSEHGYLPGDLIGLAKFYAALAGIYFLINLWYACGMKRYQDSAIPIQKYIIASMVLGLLELVFRTMDLFIWNEQGTRAFPVLYIALVLGVLKRGLARCLGVMVAMGWGVIRESLGTSMFKIVFLGLLYCGLTAARDVLAIFAVTDVQSISTEEEDELIDLVLVLTPMIIVINLVFYFWIMNSLKATTQYLQNMNQVSKLRRHLRLRCIIMISLFIAFSWLILNIAEVFTDFLSQDQQWIMEAAMHTNYVFVLVGMAILWRPNSNAKDYALQLELPAMGDDAEGDYELELSCVVVPSAEDGMIEEGQFT